MSMSTTSGQAAHGRDRCLTVGGIAHHLDALGGQDHREAGAH
jgi:hypothetical protein